MSEMSNAEQQQPTQVTVPAGWIADPMGRHELRYWDGQLWTDHVSDGGTQSVDPLSPAPAAVTSDSPVTTAVEAEPASAFVPDAAVEPAAEAPTEPAAEPAQAPTEAVEPDPAPAAALPEAAASVAAAAPHIESASIAPATAGRPCPSCGTFIPRRPLVVRCPTCGAATHMEAKAPLPLTELSKLGLFQACTPEDLKGVADAVTGPRRLVDGELICSEGDNADRWWVVVQGTADVTVGGLYAGTIGPGETVGELALLDGEPRGATVTATTDMVLYEVDGEGFLSALLASPHLSVALLGELAVRIRRANQRPSRPATPPDLTATVAAAPGTAQPMPFDPRAPGYVTDPYLQLNALLDGPVIVWSDAIRSSVVSRYHLVRYLTRHPSLRGSLATTPVMLEEAGRPAGSTWAVEADKMMMCRDGAGQARLRQLVADAFTPRAVWRWRDKTESAVEAMLDSAAERGYMDVMAEFALPLPALIVSEMLGVPEGAVPQMAQWSRALNKSMDPLKSWDDDAAAVAAASAMSAYLADVIAHRRAYPGQDLLTGLIHAADAGEGLAADEVVAQAMQMYVAGPEMTSNLIGTGLTHLFRFPDQLDRLRADPTVDANAVEELLRFDSPAPFTFRVSQDTVDLGGMAIPAGTHLSLSLAAANRDPRKWGATANTLDLARSGANEHVSFGGGPHYCLGSALARMIGHIALPSLVRRFPRIAPAYPEPAWIRSMVFRGVETLPVTLR
jgi:cytochrome P450